MNRGALARIIGQLVPAAGWAKGFLIASSAWHAASACGCVPPAGSQLSVQCLVALPVVLSSVTCRETLGLAAAPVPGAGVVPHAAMAAVPMTAMRLLAAMTRRRGPRTQLRVAIFMSTWTRDRRGWFRSLAVHPPQGSDDPLTSRFPCLRGG